MEFLVVYSTGSTGPIGTIKLITLNIAKYAIS